MSMYLKDRKNVMRESRDIICVLVAVSKVMQQTSALAVWNGSEPEHSFGVFDGELLAEDPDLVDCLSDELFLVTVYGKHDTKGLERLIGKCIKLEGVTITRSGDSVCTLLNLSNRKCRISIVDEPPTMLMRLLHDKRGQRMHGGSSEEGGEATTLVPESEAILSQTTDIASENRAVEKHSFEAGEGHDKGSSDVMVARDSSIQPFRELYEKISSGSLKCSSHGTDVGKEMLECSGVLREADSSLDSSIDAVDVDVRLHIDDEDDRSGSATRWTAIDGHDGGYTLPDNVTINSSSCFADKNSSSTPCSSGKETTEKNLISVVSLVSTSCSSSTPCSSGIPTAGNSPINVDSIVSTPCTSLTASSSDAQATDKGTTSGALPAFTQTTRSTPCSSDVQTSDSPISVDSTASTPCTFVTAPSSDAQATDNGTISISSSAFTETTSSPTPRSSDAETSDDGPINAVSGVSTSSASCSSDVQMTNKDLYDEVAAEKDVILLTSSPASESCPSDPTEKEVISVDATSQVTPCPSVSTPCSLEALIREDAVHVVDATIPGTNTEFSWSPLILQTTQWGIPTLYRALPPVIVTHDVEHFKPISVTEIRSRNTPFECRLVARVTDVFPSSSVVLDFIWGTCKKCKKCVTLSSITESGHSVPSCVPCPWCKHSKLSLLFLLVLSLSDPSGKTFVFAKGKEAVDLLGGFSARDVCNPRSLGARHVSEVLSKLRSRPVLDVILSAYEEQDRVVYYRVVRTSRCKPL